MKKIINVVVLLILSTLFYSCSALDSIGKTTSDLLQPVPQNIKEEATSKVNLETELYGIGSAPISESGLGFAISKATIDARSKLKDAITKESGMVFNSFIMDMEVHMKKIYTPVIPDLTSYTIEKVAPKFEEKGSWNDGSRAYVLLVVKRSYVLQESKNALTKYTTLLETQLGKVKNSIKGVTLPVQNTNSSIKPTQGGKGNVKNIEDFNISDSTDGASDLDISESY